MTNFCCYLLLCICCIKMLSIWCFLGNTILLLDLNSYFGIFRFFISFFLKFMILSFIILHTASFFHEFWKRKQAEIEYEWDVADFEDGEVFSKHFAFLLLLFCCCFFVGVELLKKYHFFYLTHKSISLEINCVSNKKKPITKQTNQTRNVMMCVFYLA